MAVNYKLNLNYLTILILVVVTSCNSQKSNKLDTKTDTESINMKAPFYTKQLPVESPRISKDYDSSKVESFFPFILYKDGSYMVSVETDEMKVYNTYAPIFQKYNYDGSGYNWAALIKLILRNENPDLEMHLQFDPEGGGFYSFADSEKSQRLFANFISKIFNDTLKIDNYLKKSDNKKFEDLGLNN